MKKLALFAVLLFTFSNCHLREFYKIRKAWEAEKVAPYHFNFEIPIRVINGHIVIEMMVGQKKGDFIFDTGARTMIDASFMQDLPRKKLGKMKHIDVQGKKQF